MNWKSFYRPFWWLCFFLLLIPSFHLALNYYNNNLGINPLQILQHSSGNWSVYTLILSLLITPLRRVLAKAAIFLKLNFGKRLSDWNWLIKMRRMFGLYCFYYATLHLYIYIYFDLALNWQWAMSDLNEKKYIWFGLVAYLILIPLAITSYKGFVRKMGRRWRTLHRLVYLVAFLISIHILIASKVGVIGPWILGSSLWLLLIYRIFTQTNIALVRAKDDGMEVPERM